ncbi:DUF6875 domain-containing protein [Nocardia jinanensis]|uniref:DUF6875 domain-containing protein n=1 Tax=Nocardia jinanensis TaxID=382504 RepID=A0A917VSW7_9NOCA|nr:hypothetical protein [Nocardia jinanensis]GGL10880.1 hypothetical protein GCM10011588_26770 [Nocardia jinanensis]
MESERIVAEASGVEFESLFEPRPDAMSDTVRWTLRRWLRGHLNRPHPQLGRPGPVCPFTGPAIAKRLVWVGIVDGTDIDQDRMRTIVDDMVDIFPTLSPQDGAGSALRTTMAVFPDLTDYDMIDTVQQAGKDQFVELGLMLGQFYPGCAEGGLWNSDFRPLDAPLPMLAVRQMVGTDYPFLVSRPNHLSAYLKQFAPAVPSMVRTDIAERIAW